MLSKCRKCHFKDLKFKNVFGGESPRTVYICHHFVGPQIVSRTGAHTHIVPPLNTVIIRLRLTSISSSAFMALPSAHFSCSLALAESNKEIDYLSNYNLHINGTLMIPVYMTGAVFN